MPVEHVAIVGAGFSGTLQAINLLRHEGPRATLIERGSRAGEGLAYGAAHPSHVLNVRAGNMSALPDDPGHFARWLEARGVADAANSFASRVTYGIYLREMLDAALATSAGRLTVRYGEVVDAVESGRGVALKLADGEALDADAAVVVAYGLLLPKPVLAAPRLGCFNVHASLLPRWRGAAPIQRAIMSGDAWSGVTIMRMEEGLDTGPMCKVGRLAITPATTAQKRGL